MADSSWYEAAREFERELLPKLKAAGLKIGEKARAGDETCKDIMKYYALLVRSFDPMTYILLKESFEKYIASIEGIEGNICSACGAKQGPYWCGGCGAT